MSDHDENSRKRSLKTLQHTASADGENLVGRPPKDLKQLLNQKTIDVSVKQKSKSCSKKTPGRSNSKQKNKHTKDDFVKPDGTPKHYWQIIAEKRQVALDDALDENKRLHEMIDELNKEIEMYKEKLEEVSCFVEVFQEELANTTNNDTGIDVNDVTADESTSN